MRHLFLAVLCVLFVTVAGACNLSDSGGGLEPEPEPEVTTCEATSCGDNATCSVVENAISCVCDPGYSGDTCDTCAADFQDNDGDGVCEESCALFENDCSGQGACSDTSGTAECECNQGYAGNDCSACDERNQDADGDGLCLPTCDELALDCGDGTCVIAGGEATCSCPDAYTGIGCSECATGYQDNDGDGVCTEGCDLVDLGCPNQQQCDDSDGTPICDCGPGDPCVDCPTGLQDEDGNGTCTAVCGGANTNQDWWDPTFRNRLAFTVVPKSDVGSGDPLTIRFNHATEVAAGRSLESGDDVRVVWEQTDGTLVELNRGIYQDAWNVDGLPVVFEVLDRAVAGTAIPGLWLYWNNSQAMAPPVLADNAFDRGAVRVDDPSSSLICDERSSSFTSIQLRQVLPNSNEFEIVARDRTGDGNAFSSVIVTNSAGIEILRRNYRDLGGRCCDPNDIVINTERVTITETDFTVRLESGEFSASRRYFGCEVFSTNNPAYGGSDEFTFRVGPIYPDFGATCPQ